MKANQERQERKRAKRAAVAAHNRAYEAAAAPVPAVDAPKPSRVPGALLALSAAARAAIPLAPFSGPDPAPNVSPTIYGLARGGAQNTVGLFRLADVRGWGYLQYGRPPEEAAALQDAFARYVIACQPQLILDLVDREIERLRRLHGESAG